MKDRGNDETRPKVGKVQEYKENWSWRIFLGQGTNEFKHQVYQIVVCGQNAQFLGSLETLGNKLKHKKEDNILVGLELNAKSLKTFQEGSQYNVNFHIKSMF